VVAKTAFVAAALVGSVAYADPPPDDAALHSSVGWGQAIVSDRASVTTEAGYDGAQQRAEATGLLEATIVSRVAVFAAVTYGEETRGTSRPALGAAVQLVDPRTSAIGARLSVAYKPEGFAEPEGELETVLNVSHVFDRNAVRMFVAYGRDPDGHESDVELGAGYLQRVARNWVVGVSSRYRHAIALADAGPRWDLVAGGVGDLLIDRWRIELLVGAGAVDTASVASGPLALASIGLDI
jgi:hypothetical protein